jgi:hypothetical protein
MSSRAVGVSIVLLAVAAVLACLLELPLIWDGGSQLAVTLIEQKPFVYLTRFHTWFMWWPTVWLSRVTENQSLLLLAYGLPFLLAPTCQRGGELVVCAEVRTCLGRMECPLASRRVSRAGIRDQRQHLAAIASVAADPRGARAAHLAATHRSGSVFGLCQFPHHIGVVILAMAFVAAFVARQCWARGALVVLLCLAAAKAVWVSVPAWSGPLFDSYAAKEASRDRMWQTFRTSVVGWVLVGLVPLWASAVDVALAPKARRWPLALLGMTAVAWIIYGAIRGEWMSAINYRRWVVPIAAPFVLAAIFDSRRSVHTPEALAGRNAAMVFLAAIFTVVLGLQALSYHRLLSGLRRETAAIARPVIASSELSCIKDNILDHWSLTTTFMFLQGRTPAQYIAATEEDSAALLADPPIIHLHEGAAYPPEPGSAGWFDHRPMLSRLRKGDR